MPNIARYIVTSGLHGCYMPDNNSGPMECATRKELAQAIRSELEMADFPKSSFKEVRIRRLWGFIRRHGSSTAHFCIVHGAREVAFHGITEEEFRAESDAE